MKNLNILIVDDEEMLQELYEIILEGNFEVTLKKANNGKAAVQLLSQEDFDLIVSDFNMPQMNGGELFIYNKTNKNIPMIICSGGEREDYSELKDFNTANVLNSFISKPFDDTDLINAVKKITKSEIPASPKPQFPFAPVIEEEVSEYIKIKLKYFLKYNSKNIEVYLDLHEDKLTKVTNPNVSFDLNKETLMKYMLKNVEYIYIQRETYIQFATENANLLKEHLQNKVHPTEIVKIAGLQFQISISGLNNIGITDFQIQMITDIIGETVNEISADDKCLKFLKKICADEGFLIGHSIMIMIIASVLCKESQLDFTSSMKRICLAAFFHDLGLEEQELSAKELKIYEIEDEKILQKIIKHPEQSAKMLPNLKEVLDDTKRIILEHHEMPNGDGYPKKLNAGQISPLSCLFILSQQITFCLMRNDFDNQRLKDFIRNNEIIFKQGNFTKFYNIASKKFAPL